MKPSSAFSRPPHLRRGILILGLCFAAWIAPGVFPAGLVVARAQEVEPSGSDPTDAILRSFDFSNVPKIQEPRTAESQEALRTRLMASPEGQALLERADELTHEYRMRQEEYKFYEALLVSVFAMVGLLLVLVFMCRRPACSAAQMVTASGLVFVIFGTILLVILADVEEQLTASIGVLGAIAGYLFGKTQALDAPGGSGRKEDARS
jgi:hypothetical protein